MKVLLVGALSWNPERIRSLHERGHRLWGLWSRSMGWDQGPYKATDGCIQPIAIANAARTIREQKIDCVYSLFQVYHPRILAPAAAGVEHDVWTLLRNLLLARERGEFDAPIVRHWGFDVQNMDVEVARAFDGQIFCNHEKLAYWTSPIRQGGCGLDLVPEGSVIDFLDSDRPKLEFMNDDPPERLSDQTGEIHTVCIGRPFGIDYLAAARRGIHLHMYGNSYDDLYRTMARDLSLSGARQEVELLRRFLHFHPSLQTIDASWEDVQRKKSTWVREFARYAAGWSYIGSPLPWDPLDDRGAIPNRLSTYLLAGLPIISDVKPGFYRYDELVRLGVNVDLVDSDYDGLRSRLQGEIGNGTRRANALRERAGYSFDSTIGPLLSVLERARERYFERSPGERTRFVTRKRRLIHFTTSPDPWARARGLLRRLWPPQGSSGGAPNGRLDAFVQALGEQVGRQTVGWKARLLARRLRPADRSRNQGSRGVHNPMIVAALERFSDRSRRCEHHSICTPNDEVVTWDLPNPIEAPLTCLRAIPGALAGWLTLRIATREKWLLARSCMETGGARLGAFLEAPELLARVRRGEVDALACFAAKEFGLANRLAGELGSDCRQVLERGTQYFGEFGFELLAVIPYAYWLHNQGRLEFTVSSADTRCLYYFSKHHEERRVARSYVPITEYPLGRGGWPRYDRKAFPTTLDAARWMPPPYKAIYNDGRFRWPKEPCIVCNKSSDEQYLWYRGPANFIPTGVVLELIGKLQKRYQVIYLRPRAADIVNDHQTVHEKGDIEAVMRVYPEVRTIQQLHAMNPDLSFNELQLRLFAGCDRFVSVLGGSSYLASYFGGTNVVYARRGWEVACGAYGNWFNRFSRARVVAAASPGELMQTVERELLGPAGADTMVGRGPAAT